MIETTEHRGRWLVLAVVSLAEMLAISCWMVSSAISEQLVEKWSLTEAQTGALTTAVQLGFVGGTLLAAILNFADLFPNRVYFSICAVLTAAANLSLLVCDSFVMALATRFLVGFFLAGVYPPAMKMIATWFQSSRGLAIGTLIGALVIGKALPFLLKALQISDWESIIVVSSVAATVSGILVAFCYRAGPFPFARKPFNLALLGEVLRHRPTRLAIGGYLGHMWELYAMWTWIAIFMTASAERSGIENGLLLSIVSFVIIASGAIGCVLGGRWSDRFGRERFVNLAMLISGACCILIGFFFAVNFWICVCIAIVWGFFVVADSAQFSTLVTEESPRHAVGTALTLQTSIGFLLTTVTIQLVPVLKQSVGWTFAFAILSLGPVFGIIAMVRLSGIRQQRKG